MRKVVPEETQAAVFSRILERPENQSCADCRSTRPNWYSLNFGVIICYNCSGEHRNLGLHITRVISTKLDCWTTEEIAVAEAVGNQRANRFWEAKKPSTAAQQLSSSASQTERRNYIKEKYIKKTWIDTSLMSPYEAVLAGKIEALYGTNSAKNVEDKQQNKASMQTPKAEPSKTIQGPANPSSNKVLL